MSSNSPQSAVVPAQLAFLTIYNPAFGATEGAEYEQIFFYHSRVDDANRKNGKNAVANSDDKQRHEEEEQNERLRQVGLARGMVEFAK
jgi:hypothetical protein